MRLIMPPGQLHLAVLASGRGSNFEALCQAIDRGDLNARIHVLVSDKEDAPALEKASQRGIKAVYIDPSAFAGRDQYETEILRVLQEQKVNLVALAGYMRLVGRVMLNAFPHRIVNIHPALLPSFTGLNAQKQALEYGVRYSGCTVHLVDEGMDTGPIIMQAVVPVLDDDSEEGLTARILKEEHRIYWQSLQLLAEGKVFIKGRRLYLHSMF
ncbi:phosphoribosylglycinamide formyltransferase [Syntrophomonas erecta]